MHVIIVLEADWLTLILLTRGQTWKGICTWVWCSGVHIHLDIWCKLRTACMNVITCFISFFINKTAVLQFWLFYFQLCLHVLLHCLSFAVNCAKSPNHKCISIIIELQTSKSNYSNTILEKKMHKCSVSSGNKYKSIQIYSNSLTLSPTC